MPAPLLNCVSATAWACNSVGAQQQQHHIISFPAIPSPQPHAPPKYNNTPHSYTRCPGSYTSQQAGCAFRLLTAVHQSTQFACLPTKKSNNTPLTWPTRYRPRLPGTGSMMGWATCRIWSSAALLSLSRPQPAKARSQQAQCTQHAQRLCTAPRARRDQPGWKNPERRHALARQSLNQSASVQASCHPIAAPSARTAAACLPARPPARPSAHLNARQPARDAALGKVAGKAATDGSVPERGGGRHARVSRGGAEGGVGQLRRGWVGAGVGGWGGIGWGGGECRCVCWQRTTRFPPQMTQWQPWTPAPMPAS